MHNKIIKTCILSSLIILAGCKTLEQQAADDARWQAEWVAESNIAQKLWNGKYKKQCIEDFKKNMNNPASLQMAGEPYYEKGYRDAPTYYWGLNKEVTFIIPARGTNSFGGLVKADIRCNFSADIQTNTMRFVGATQF